MPAGTSVKLVIPSEVRLVDLVHTAAEKMAELAGFESDDALNLGLAVREAVINAIVHGNRRDAKLKVDVSMTVREGSVEVRVRDRGQGFDPAATPDPTVEANLLRTSGRGILLMRAFVDQVAFRRGRDRGMETTLTKRSRQG
ncbi:MAG TPA: ATP-binding protein [Candidatus Polarisedimenticolaceae bacterium]|nr:ATP-binding protein [Candidatus Polarisedimenticolaceae bacterium]